MENPQELYATYNTRYFGGKLPVVDIEMIDLKSHDYYGKCSEPGQPKYRTRRPKEPRPARFKIQISKWTKKNPKILAMTLLHEMVHVKLWDVPGITDHGRRFDKEMTRLAVAGAFNGLW